MKIQSLAIIFIIIIIPISLVLSEYVDNKITIAKTELEYNTKLLNATHDAIKAYQINNINNAYSDISTSKVEDIESAVRTLYNSITNNFGYTGYRSNIMKDYIPAVVFTLYDGYYIYSPFKNTLTTTKKSDGQLELRSGDSYGDNENVSTEYRDGKTLDGLKPYVYYSMRYKKDDKDDVVITYTLDNYITVQGLVDGKYEYQYGYLINSIDEEANNTYEYHGIQFTKDTKEVLQELVPTEDGTEEIKSYKYAKINGKKYHLDEDGESVFFIDDNGKRNYNQFANNQEDKQKLINAINGNKSAYEYYKNSHDFTNWVNENLNWITPNLAQTIGQYDFGDSTTPLFSGSIDYENNDSVFNRHRQEVIRYVIQTNLQPAIEGFSSKASGNTEFIMPKISEENWEIIENNVTAISFLQGLNMGSKKYNGYAVVPNNLSKEYIDENDIYILLNNDTYSKSNDSNITKPGVGLKSGLGYQPGVWKIDFEEKKCINNDGNEIKYYPNDYKGNYTSVMGSSGLKETSIINSNIKNMYNYMNDYINNKTNATPLKTAYYTALARERWGAYHVNNNLDLKYFINSY